MAYMGDGPTGSVLIGTSSNTNEFATTVVMAGSLTAVGLITTGSLVAPYVETTTTPYVVLSTDFVVAIDSTGAIKTVHLPNAPTTNQMFIIKDVAGTSSAFNITVTTQGGVVLIDAASTYVLNVDYMAIMVIFNGTKYVVI